MSIKDRALQEHEYAVAAAALDADARKKRHRLDLEHACRSWIQEHLGVEPEEVILIERFGGVSKAAVVHLEDDIWLCWATEGRHVQTHAAEEPACWYIYLDKHVRQAYNTTKKGVGPEGWNKAVVDVGLAHRVFDLASLGNAIATHERWKEKHA